MNRRTFKRENWDDSIPDNWFKRYGWLRQAKRHDNDFWWVCPGNPGTQAVPGRLLATSKVRGR